jgi:ubiquinone/menaquinone biosynthesis C-methylase UbiE
VTSIPIYSAPFDAVAEDYDQTFTSSNVGRAQRAEVWKDLGRTFRAGDRILEIGCGTGVDACFLARRGVTVVACDSSPAMIAVAERRVRQANELKVQLHLMPAEALSELSPRQCFDGGFSNFGALNCVEDLQAVVSALARLLKPGAIFLVCMMGRHCVWEVVWYLAHGNLPKAFRRIRRGSVSARLAPGATIRIFYPSVNSIIRIFSQGFRLKYWKGIGVAVPPSYLEHLAQRHPKLLRLMTRADSCLGKSFICRGSADHILLSFERVSESGGLR